MRDPRNGRWITTAIWNAGLGVYALVVWKLSVSGPYLPHFHFWNPNNHHIISIQPCPRRKYVFAKGSRSGPWSTPDSQARCRQPISKKFTVLSKNVEAKFDSLPCVALVPCKTSRDDLSLTRLLNWTKADVEPAFIFQVSNGRIIMRSMTTPSQYYYYTLDDDLPTSTPNYQFRLQHTESHFRKDRQLVGILA